MVCDGTSIERAFCVHSHGRLTTPDVGCAPGFELSPVALDSGRAGDQTTCNMNKQLGTESVFEKLENFYTLTREDVIEVKVKVILEQDRKFQSRSKDTYLLFL